MAIGAAGWAVVGALEAAGVIPTLYRYSLAPASGAEAAFPTALALSLAYYHRRWSLGVVAAALTLIVPCSVNLLWARFLRVSLLYPFVSILLIGVMVLAVAHYRIAGLQPVDFAEEAMVRRIMENVKPLPLFDRLLLLCIIVSVVALILVHLLR